jgi:hypothetical protein
LERIRAPRPARLQLPRAQVAWLAAAAIAVAAALVALTLVMAGGDGVRDNVRPADPLDVRSTSHTAGEASAARSIRVVWSPATDGGPEGGEASGVAGYSIAWSNAPVTLPDMTADLPAEATSADSPALEDGDWWFHLSTVDGAGNWTRTVHLGPFVIAASSRTATATPEQSTTPINASTPPPQPRVTQGAPAPIVTVPPAQVPTDTPPATTTTPIPTATFGFPGGGNGGRH